MVFLTYVSEIQVGARKDKEPFFCLHLFPNSSTYPLPPQRRRGRSDTVPTPGPLLVSSPVVRRGWGSSPTERLVVRSREPTSLPSSVTPGHRGLLSKWEFLREVTGVTPVDTDLGGFSQVHFRDLLLLRLHPLSSEDIPQRKIKRIQNEIPTV